MKSGFECARAPSVNFVDSSLPEGAIKPPSLREVARRSRDEGSFAVLVLLLQSASLTAPSGREPDIASLFEGGGSTESRRREHCGVRFTPSVSFADSSLGEGA